MFGIGPMEAIIIALVAVIFVGPDKLPGVLKKFGRFYVQAKRHANDVKSSFDQAIHEAERDLELDRIRELQRQIQETASLHNIIDADHTAATTHVDPGHTEDGRLIEAPKAEGDQSALSALPPEEIEASDKAAYHEGHLPAREHREDHDPFSSEALQIKELVEQEPKAPESESKKS